MKNVTVSSDGALRLLSLSRVPGLDISPPGIVEADDHEHMCFELAGDLKGN